MSFEKPGIDNFENKPTEKKREAGVMRVFGAGEKEGEFLEYFVNKNKENKLDENWEREKTETELALIKKINEKMKDFVERYGGTFLEVRPENIHILDHKKFSYQHWKFLKEVLDPESVFGKFNVMHENIAILLIRGEDIFEFAKFLVHEMLHFNSFQSVEVKWTNESEEKERLFLEKKVGISMRGKHEEEEMERVYLILLNEALTEELSSRFREEYFGDFEELQKGIEMRKIYLSRVGNKSLKLDEIKVCTFQKRKGHWKTNVSSEHAYKQERKYLNNLVDQLYQQNEQRFASREEVFNLFAKAAFDGKILEVARLIEKTFGKGHFRKVAMEMAKDFKKHSLEFKKEENE